MVPITGDECRRRPATSTSTTVPTIPTRSREALLRPVRLVSLSSINKNNGCKFFPFFFFLSPSFWPCPLTSLRHSPPRALQRVEGPLFHSSGFVASLPSGSRSLLMQLSDISTKPLVASCRRHRSGSDINHFGRGFDLDLFAARKGCRNRRLASPIVIELEFSIARLLPQTHFTITNPYRGRWS